MRFYMAIRHGKCYKHEVLPAGEEREVTFRFAGPYRHWIAVCKRELDPIQGLMQGKFRLKGDMAELMRYVRAAQALVNTIMKVPTEFL
jgi:putative sterol carrier protein